MLEDITARGVLVEGVGDVRNYLLSHPRVADVLADVVRDARHALGDDGQLVLTVDMSLSVGNEWLLLLLRQLSYDERIIQITRDMDCGAQSRLGGWDWRFIVTTDFKPVS